MKRFVTILLLISVAVIAAPFLFQSDRPMPSITGLPWQIAIHNDGTSSVFGITLERTSLAETQSRFGEELEIAVIARAGEPGALEAYVPHFTAGVLTGKLVLSTQLSDDAVQRLREHATRANPTATGALKFSLAPADAEHALATKITAITFIPAVDIDQNTAVKRFGEPSRRLTDHNGTLHYLYPDKGLDLMLNADQKDVLQYVAPQHFERLLRPLARAR